jgi:fluoride exporter
VRGAPNLAAAPAPIHLKTRQRAALDKLLTVTPILIAVAGGLGSVLRYAVGIALANTSAASLPSGTLAVNVIGSCLLGITTEWLRGQTFAGVDLRLVLGVGLLGGFTTYSSFNLELLRMLETGALARAAGYFALTTAGCLLAGAAGITFGRLLMGR